MPTESEPSADGDGLIDLTEGKVFDDAVELFRLTHTNTWHLAVGMGDEVVVRIFL